MIDSQVLTSDGNTLVQDTFDKGEAETVKAFVFDGDPKNGVLLNAVSYEDEVSEVSADPIKVACVGDSLTEGNGASDGNEYPAQLQRMLGRGYEVKNFGVGSRTVCASGNDKDGAALKYTEYVGYYKGQRLWEPTYTYSIYENGVWVPQWTSTHPKTSVYEDSKSFNPDIVVIQLGTNDAAKLDLSQEALQEEFTDVYAGMIEEYKKTAKEIYVVVPPLYGKEASGSVNQKIVNYIKPILEGFVKDYGVKMINMQYGPTASQQTDGIHYTNAGYKVMAKTVYDAIKDKIEYSYDGSEISVKPAASVYGNIVAAAYDNSGLSGLEMIGNGKEILPPNVATVIDTSSIATGAAAIKVMAWDSFNSMKPVAKVGEKTAAGYSVSNGVTTVTGKTAPNSSVVITAYDADENLVYVNNVLTDYDSDYSFSFAGDSASVYVNGTAVDVK